jgi:malonyl CoA-acyl carrier protein transacylase/acyl carrier protein
MTGWKLSVLFPGQGAFDGEALSAASKRYPQVKQVFAAIDTVSAEVSSVRLTDVLFGAEPPTMEQLLAGESWLSQLAIFGADVAAYRVLADQGMRPDMMVGHSLGEIAALVAANAFTVEDGARAVLHRVRVLEELDLAGGRMVALAADAKRVQQIIELVGDDQLAIATENHEKQTVVSGPGRSIDRVAGIAEHLQIGKAELKSPFPFHTPMLAAAVPAFAERLRTLVQHPLDVPVFSPILGRYYRDDDALADLLATHFVTPVRFGDAVRALYDDGVRYFVEAGCLGTLSGLVHKTMRDGDSVTSWPSLQAKRGDLVLDRTLAELRARGLVEGGVGELAAIIAPDAHPDVFARFWATAGAEIAELIRGRLTEFQVGETAETPAPDVAAGAAEPPSVERETLGAEIRALYSAALEYPEEVFDDDVLLEAELGVDSVKQVELLSRVVAQYELPANDGKFRLADHDTMGKIVDFVHDAVRGVAPVTA